MIATEKSTPPIIIMGMHRSGTSLVTRLLEDIGVFLGRKKDDNNEAFFFQDLNIWLMAQAGARWDAPLSTDLLFENDDVVSAIADYLTSTLRGPRTIQYLGLPMYLKHRGLHDLSFPWGWKDPRNTFTLPFWLQLYPAAKVVYVERHGVDVANSLIKRQQSYTKRALDRYWRVRRFGYVFKKKGDFMQSLRCGSLERAFDLWEEYVFRGRAHVHALGSDRCLTVKYEDLVERSSGHVAALADFCGIKASKEEIENAVGHCKKSRAYAYRSSPYLEEFAASVSERLGNPLTKTDYAEGHTA